MVFDQPFRLVALITPLLLRIRQSIEQRVGAVNAATWATRLTLRVAIDLPMI